MSNVSKLQPTVLKNHEGIFTRVQQKQLVRKVAEEVVTGIWPREKSANLGMVILEFVALTDASIFFQKRATFWKDNRKSF